MKNFCIVAHPRSGSHWILDTIFRNFHTPYTEYWQMFGSHKLDIDTLREERPDTVMCHISRDIQHVLMSVFRMRERNGISIKLGFSDFLRTKYKNMQRTNKKNTQILFDDKMVTQTALSWIGNQPHTPPELWLATNYYWQRLGIQTITYEQMKTDQNFILGVVSNITGWKKKKQVSIKKTVGWHPPNNKSFDVSVDDQQLMDEFRDRFSQGVGK